MIFTCASHVNGSCRIAASDVSRRGAAIDCLTVVSAADDAALASFIAQHGLKQNVVKPPQGMLLHEYIVPDGPYFQLFDWDMYFMSAALSYDKVWRPVVGSIEDFLAFVDEFANWTGYTPREIAPDATWALPEMCKPFLAQAAVRASLTSGDVSWLRASDPPVSICRATSTASIWRFRTWRAG